MNERIYYSKDAENRARRNGVMVATMAIILGAAAGVIVALLFAPRPGDEIRDELARGAGDILGSARQTTESVAKEAGKAVHQVRERIEDRVNHG
jgi:gas vesicle protein